MKNRIRELTHRSEEQTAMEEMEKAAAAIDEISREASRTIGRWASGHPLSCLAAAFVAGAALAWLIKRR